MDFGNSAVGVGNDCGGSFGTSCFFTTAFMNRLFLSTDILLLFVNFNAGYNGNLEYSTECSFCCQPCNVGWNCCRVLCAYNTCFLGQFSIFLFMIIISLSSILLQFLVNFCVEGT